VENPYQRPAAAVADRVVRERYSDQLDDVAYGQKNVVYSILLYFFAAATLKLFGILALFAFIICIGLSWSGIYRITRGLKYPFWLRVVFLALMLLPVIGLLILLFLNNRATVRLKKAGFSVGLLGARRY